MLKSLPDNPNKGISNSVEKNNLKQCDPKKYLFFVYIKWSRENRDLKTYMRAQKDENEITMVCNGLADFVENPEMKLNNKNIKMAVLYQLEDDVDISTALDVTGIVPTRLDHYLNSSRERINFSQNQIDRIVNRAEFEFRQV